MSAYDRAVTAFLERYGHEPEFVVRAPGRVNIIGEHTDYNDGFVLPMALPFDIVIATARRPDGLIEASSEGFGTVTIDPTGKPDPAAGWATYVHGTASLLASEGHLVGGWQGCVASDIPTGASLSSSAALEVASGLASVTAAGSTIDGHALALIGQRVENEVLGLPSGIMDQLASATSVEGSASLIDCRTLELRSAPLPPGVRVIIMDTGTRRELVESEYAARQADCRAAAAALGVAALRDASPAQLDAIDDERIRRRARHILGENQRTLDAAAAMHRGDANALGELMGASHVSLRDDYEVSGPALDAIVELAVDTPGCLGARMTGGGFAGCAVALVEADAAADFIARVRADFVSPHQQRATEPTTLWAVDPAPGAQVLRPR